MMKFRSSHRLWIVIAVTAMLLIVVAGQVSAGSAGEDVLVASPMPTEHPSAIVATGALNVRNGPNVSYRSVAVIYQGQVVTLLGRWWGSNWVSIRLYNGLEGWVNSVYLQTSVPIADLPVVGGEPPPQPEPVPPIAGPVAVVNTGALNVRSGPSPAYPSLAVVTSGQQLLLIGRNAAATWAKVQISNGVQGWVNVYYTQTSVPVVNLPVVDAPVDPGYALGVVNTGAVNVRTGPGAQYNSIAVLSGGTSVSLIGRNADASWTKVRLSNGVEGWIGSGLLQTNVPIWSLSIVETPPPQNAAVVNVGALNVRYGPGTGYDPFGVVYRGQVVTLVGRAALSTWAQVRIPSGALGWVNSNYLLSDVPFNSLPVTGP